MKSIALLRSVFIFLIGFCPMYFEHVWLQGLTTKERKDVDPGAVTFAKTQGEIEGLGLSEGASLIEVVSYLFFVQHLIVRAVEGMIYFRKELIHWPSLLA